MTFRPFLEAREFVHTLGLKNSNDWIKYCKSGKKPLDIPSYPDAAYKNEWINLGDWLGTGTMIDPNKIYRSFDEAKDFIKSLKLKDVNEWVKY